MNPEDRSAIIERYRLRLREHENEERILATGPQERQRIRFDAIMAVGDLQGVAVLDVGCGIGNFYEHLQRRGVEVDYTGYDIVPEFVEIGRERFPAGRFEVRDVQEHGIDGRFDYVVSSQAFNNRLAHASNMDLAREVLEIAFRAADRGVAVDFLTSYVDYREPHLFYYSPEELFAYAKSMTKRVSLYHHHPLYEFVLCLYPDFPGWGGG